ncbi:MAG: FdhF/YdeP family oxidoreductase [Phycisphaerae bacterium]|nr:FdhF/YdeP family oxidoreductase [Phycisphaerae bacterium]NUQ46635.1 FdhF/YdeP family oxidoreductase [Phycisphaerae bacterium]
MRAPRSGGGWSAIWYSLRMARRAGGVRKLYHALRAKNACKTCALGMGGQSGGMVNEAGHFPEVCKKSMQAMVADMQGRITPEFFARYGFAELRSLSPRELEHAGRLNDPLYAGPEDAHYRPISWDEALKRCTARLKGSRPDENFFYFSGRASNEAAFFWQLFARLYGTNNVNNCSYYCHQASGVGLKSAIGAGTATVTLDDVAHCDLFFLIGGNPASNHPRLMAMLADLRRRGGHVIVINPLRETGLVSFRVPSRLRSLLFGDTIASLYLQPHIGGDIALLTGIAKAIVEMQKAATQAADLDFIGRHTEGFETFREHVREVRWSDLERDSGVSRADIERAARLYAGSRATIFAWTMGVTHHVHGVDNVRAIVNLALLRGMVGRPHAGLLPIRGHSNVQGVGSMGVTPRLAPIVLERLQAQFGVTLPTTPGMDTLACIRAMQDGTMRHAWCLGGNLFGATPDAARTAAAFARLDSIVYMSTTLNTGHAWGRARETMILPVRARDEESQATTQESMFNYVRLSDGGPARLPGPRSEVELVACLARRVLTDRASAGPLDWSALERHENIRRLIASIIPGYEAMGEIDRTRREFHIDGRILHEPKFRTPGGRARFHVPALPRFDDAAGALRLMTLRSEGQFNTVVYEEADLYRGQERRDVILMSDEDIRRFGLREDQRVTVVGPAGRMRGILVRRAPIRAGNAAMYYPEANVLVPDTADAESHTPAFKNVPIRLEA